jgi:hypothetical protein
MRPQAAVTKVNKIKRYEFGILWFICDTIIAMIPRNRRRQFIRFTAVNVASRFWELNPGAFMRKEDAVHNLYD